jgi:hypothetical protein
LAALVGPEQNICFLTVHSFNSFAPISQQAWQKAVLGRMSLSMCLWFPVSFMSTFQHISNEPQFAVLYAVNQ